METFRVEGKYFLGVDQYFTSKKSSLTFERSSNPRVIFPISLSLEKLLHYFPFVANEDTEQPL